MLDPHGLHPLALSYCIFVKKRVPSDAIVRPAIQRNAMGDPTSKCAAMHGDQRLCWDSSTVRQSLRRQTLSDLGDDLKEKEGAGGGGEETARMKRHPDCGATAMAPTETSIALNNEM